jgi:hypothetical protein
VKLAIVLLLSGIMSGCQEPAVSKPFTTPPSDYIEELKAVAKKHRFYYLIFCTPWQSDPRYQFQAELCEAKCELLYAEDGGKDWYAGSGHTQQAAAQAVLLSFADKNVHHPSHHPAPVVEDHKQCPPEISGGP